MNQLDAMILGAAEIDLDFDVNVTTGSGGMVMGGSGGHADTAAGAKLALMTTRLNAGGHAKIVDRVTTMTTPGETVDAVVTEQGVAVNPHRDDLRSRLLAAGVRVVGIDELERISRENGAGPRTLSTSERIAAVVEYRDGTVIDVVRVVE